MVSPEGSRAKVRLRAASYSLLRVIASLGASFERDWSCETTTSGSALKEAEAIVVCAFDC